MYVNYCPCSTGHTKNIFCFIQDLVDHSHPRAKQPVSQVIRQQLLAVRPLTEQPTLTLRKERILKMTWILSQAWARPRQQRVRNVTLYSNA